MASQLPHTICDKCEIRWCSKKPCIVCNEDLCFECAVGFHPGITYEMFEKHDFYVCRRKCMQNRIENPNSEESEETPEEVERSPSGRRSLEDGERPGPSKSPSATPSGNGNDKPVYTRFHYPRTKKCPACLRLQPDYRTCQKCKHMYQYNCEDECWGIEDEFDSFGKKKLGGWYCYWCETGNSDTRCFKRDKRRFVRVQLPDLTASLDDIMANKKTMVFDDEVACITVKPPELPSRPLPTLRLAKADSSDVIDPIDVAQARSEEELRTYVRQAREKNQETVIDVGSSYVFLDPSDTNDVIDIESSASLVDAAEKKFGVVNDECLTSYQQALLDDAMATTVVSADTSVEKPIENVGRGTEDTKSDNPSASLQILVKNELENLQRDIEDMETLTRAKMAKESGADAQASGSLTTELDKVVDFISEATIKERIRAAQRAVVAFQVTTQQMKENTMECIRASLEGKVSCLLKIWNNRGKK